MSAENGTIGQYEQFFGERVEMSWEVLKFEAMAMLGFNPEQMESDISFPSTFWIAIRTLLNKLSINSLDTVKKSEKKVTASELLIKFGNMTTKETMDTHKELVSKTGETHESLSIKLPESRAIFAATINKIKQLIIEYHKEELEMIPTESDDKEVIIYLNQTSENEAVKESLDTSKTAFTPIATTRKERREEVLKSLSDSLKFVKELSNLAFLGHRGMSLGLQTT